LIFRRVPRDTDGVAVGGGTEGDEIDVGVQVDIGEGLEDGGVEVAEDGGASCGIGAASGGVAGDTGVEGDEACVGIGGYVRESFEDCGGNLGSGDIAGTGSGIVG
jgi:hypothetical protein